MHTFSSKILYYKVFIVTGEMLARSIINMLRQVQMIYKLSLFVVHFVIFSGHVDVILFVFQCMWMPVKEKVKVVVAIKVLKEGSSAAQRTIR
jgi:hypothetical protein